MRECVQRYVFDIQSERRFERGNHNADGLDYIETESSSIDCPRL